MLRISLGDYVEINLSVNPSEEHFGVMEVKELFEDSEVCCSKRGRCCHHGRCRPHTQLPDAAYADSQHQTAIICFACSSTHCTSRIALHCIHQSGRYSFVTAGRKVFRWSLVLQAGGHSIGSKRGGFVEGNLS